MLYFLMFILTGTTLVESFEFILYRIERSNLIKR